MLLQSARRGLPEHCGWSPWSPGSPAHLCQESGHLQRQVLAQGEEPAGDLLVGLVRQQQLLPLGLPSGLRGEVESEMKNKVTQRCSRGCRGEAHAALHPIQDPALVSVLGHTLQCSRMTPEVLRGLYGTPEGGGDRTWV